MMIQACISNNATVETRPASELLDGGDVELIIYVDGGDNLTLTMSKDKGMEIVNALARQLDKVDEITQHRKESHQKMMDSIAAIKWGVYQNGLEINKA